jgi:hypothetical protein
MVLLHFRTDNSNNEVMAKFDSLYQGSYIQYSNISGNVYLGGLSNDQIKFFNSNNSDDRGLRYKNNIISVDNINCLNLKNNEFRIFPNPQTPISNYELNEPTSISSFGCINCFDINNFTFWQSENVYSSINGFARTDTTIHKFQNSYGHYIKIRFPYQFVPIGFSVNSVENFNDPLDFDIYGSLDETRWTKIGVITQNEFSNVFTINNSNLYLFIVVVITRIRINPSLASFQSFKIYELKIISKPILILDDNIKVSDNSIYNIESINTKKLYLNDVPINSLTELNSNALMSALDDFKNQYSYYWKNIGNVGFPDSNIINKMAIGKSNAISTFDINGDISFFNRSISQKIIISTLTTPYSSSYISIGKINMKALANKNYFHIKVFIVDITKYYFQTLNIYGYSFVDVNTNTNKIESFKLYWDTTFDNTNAIQRITDVVFIIDFGSEPIIKIYIKYNDLLDITFTSTISGFRDLFINHIYIDELQTSTNDILFIPATTIETLNLPNFTTAINTYSINLSSNVIINNSNILNYLSTGILNISSNVNVSNILMLNSNKNLIDTNISFNSLSNLKNSTNLINKIACFDDYGFLNSINLNRNILNSFETAIQKNNQILITNNGIYEPLLINKNNLSNLDIISSNPNSIVIIDQFSNLRTTKTIDVANVDKLMGLFNFNFSNNFNHKLKLNSNTNIDNFSINSNLYIGGHIINSNYKSNRLFINNKEIGEDIFRIIVKIPNNDDRISSINNSIPILNNIKKYVITLTNGINITIEVDENDDSIDITTLPYNIFNKYKYRQWKTQNNFVNYNDFYNTNSFKYVYDDFTGISKCGAYIIFDFGQPFVLNFYALYVNYNDFKTSIRDFRLLGFKQQTSTWAIIDDKRNIKLNNDITPNFFTIDYKDYDVYTKFALCIINTHNDTGIPNYCLLNFIEFYGYIPNNNNYNYSNLTFNYLNNPFLFGKTFVGISNINPLVPLCIGNDLSTNSTEALMNLNHNIPTSINNIEKPLINLTRPSLLTSGVKAVHYINSWYESNTNYTLKLSHMNTSNERVVLSMNSDGRVGIGTYPNINDCNNGLSIYNNGLSFYSNNLFMNMRTSNIVNSYDIIFPKNIGNLYNSLGINKINNRTLELEWINPIDVISSNSFSKIGIQTIPTRNEAGVVLQIAGSCLMGSNNVGTLNSSFLRNNSLVVCGSIYSTTDITTDSDISYKFNFKIIKNPLEKINKIRGYTFNRNDVNDNNRYTGLIAQEVLKILPEAIVKKHDGKLRILYTNLAGLFVEGIRELNQKYDYLNFKINLSIISGLLLLIGNFIFN